MHIRNKVKNIIMNFVPEKIAVHKLNGQFHNSLLFTFDDGPNPQITPLILDILKEYKIKAVFFLVGRFAKECPDLVRRIYVEGHIIGNHTYQHDNNKVPNFNDYMADINKCQLIIAGITGEKPKFFRPPRGIMSIKIFFASILKGLILVYWTASGQEWTINKNSDSKIISESLSNTIRGGDIILLHDNNPNTPEVLKILLNNTDLNNTFYNNGINYINMLWKRHPN